MAVLQALRTALGVVRSNPVVLVAAFAFALAGQLLVYAQVLAGPTLANLTSVAWVPIWPLVLGGLVAMLAEALPDGAGNGDGSSDGSDDGSGDESGDGSGGPNRTSLATFRRGAREHYLSLLVATVALVVVMLLASVVWTVALIALVIAAAASDVDFGGLAERVVDPATGAVDPTALWSDPTALTGLAALLALALVAFGIPYVFVQFYDVAVVTEGASGIGAHVRSVRVVLANPASVIGYTVLFTLVNWIGQAPTVAAYLFAVEFTETGAIAVTSWPTLAASSALALTLGAVTTGVAYAYHVAFFDRIA